MGAIMLLSGLELTASEAENLSELGYGDDE